MSKIAVISDSTGYIPTELLEELDIYLNHLLIIFENQSYREFKDINEEQFLKLCEQQEKLPSTSQPSPGSTIELYESLLDKGYDEILHITISSQLSGSYQSAVSCAEIVDSNRIHVLDSKTVAYPQGALAIEAARLAKEGKSISDILNVLEQMHSSSRLIAAIYELTNLKKGGRLSNAEATLGTLMKIKPICEVKPDGTLQAVEKVRTYKKALKRLGELAIEAHLTEEYELVVMHLANEEQAKALQQDLQQAYPNHTVNILPLSLIIGVHVGPGTVVVGWMNKGI